MNRKPWLITIGAAAAMLLLGLVTFPVFAEDDADADDDDDNEVTVKLADLPAAVRKTLEKEAAGGKIGEIEKETENGKTTYEADVTINGEEREIEIAEDGKLISNEADDEEDDDDDDDDD